MVEISNHYLNRWIQPDEIIPDPDNPQSWDRYAYVENNPVRYTDPTGHAECEGWRCGTANDDLEEAKVYEAKANSINSDEYHGHKKEYFSIVAAYHYARAAGASSEEQGSYLDLIIAKHSALIINGYYGRDAALDTAVRVTPPESMAGIATGVSSAASTIILGVNKSLDQIATDISDWVSQGDGAYTIINDDGDFILVNVGNTRRFRFDLYGTDPHQNPHMHLEWTNDNGKWVKPGPIYPYDVAPH